VVKILFHPKNKNISLIPNEEVEKRKMNKQGSYLNYNFLSNNHKTAKKKNIFGRCYRA
jgi:hypothetical protein